jgi:hypothetical protein
MILAKLSLLLLLVVFAASSDPYRTKLASRLTHFSAIAYDSQELIEKWTCDYCKGIEFKDAKVVYNDSNSVYGYVGYSPEY